MQCIPTVDSFFFTLPFLRMPWLWVFNLDDVITQRLPKNSKFADITKKNWILKCDHIIRCIDVLISLMNYISNGRSLARSAETMLYGIHGSKILSFQMHTLKELSLWSRVSSHQTKSQKEKRCLSFWWQINIVNWVVDGGLKIQI